MSTCQPDAQADYEESLCISQTVESSILTALWGKEGKGERRMCCDAGTEAVLKITVHTCVSHPHPGVPVARARFAVHRRYLATMAGPRGPSHCPSAGANGRIGGP